MAPGGIDTDVSVPQERFPAIPSHRIAANGLRGSVPQERFPAIPSETGLGHLLLVSVPQERFPAIPSSLVVLGASLVKCTSGAIPGNP